MSLSVTAVVQAAGAPVRERVEARAAGLLRDGFRFGEEIRYAPDSDLILAAGYVGLVLVDGPVRRTSSAADVDTVEVCASREWSATPLFRSATGRLLTHGELVDAVSGGVSEEVPWWPDPLTTAVRDLFPGAAD